MKGPFERLKHDLRRVWECPVCRHKERTSGAVTFRLCLCQRKVEIEQRVWMRLVEDHGRCFREQGARNSEQRAESPGDVARSTEEHEASEPERDAARIENVD